MTYTAKKGKTKKKKALRSSPLDPTHFYSEQYAICHISRVQNPLSRGLPLRMALLTRAFHRKIKREKKKKKKLNKQENKSYQFPKQGKTLPGKKDWSLRSVLQPVPQQKSQHSLTHHQNKSFFPEDPQRWQWMKGPLYEKVSLCLLTTLSLKKSHMLFFFSPFKAAIEFFLCWAAPLFALFKYLNIISMVIKLLQPCQFFHRKIFLEKVSPSSRYRYLYAVVKLSLSLFLIHWIYWPLSISPHEQVFKHTQHFVGLPSDFLFTPALILIVQSWNMVLSTWAWQL